MRFANIDSANLPKLYCVHKLARTYDLGSSSNVLQDLDKGGSSLLVEVRGFELFGSDKILLF